MIFFKKITKAICRLRSFLLVMTILLIIFDLLSELQNGDWLTVFIALLWLLTSLGYELNSNISIFVALVWLFFEIIFYVLNNNLVAEKLSVWIFVFLCIAMVQLLFEIVTNTSNISDIIIFQKIKKITIKIISYFHG